MQSPSGVRPSWFLAVVVLALPACVASPDDDTTPGDPGAVVPGAGPLLDAPARGDDGRSLSTPREQALAACLDHCDARARAVACPSPAVIDADVAACLEDCPGEAAWIDDACIELQRASWACLATATWSCFGGDIPNVDADVCAAERAAAEACIE